MAQVWTYSAPAESLSKEQNIDKIQYPDGFDQLQFVNDISYGYREDIEIKEEYGIESSTDNPMGIALTSVRQTITEEFLVHKTAAQAVAGSVVINPTDMKRLLKTDGLIFTRAVVSTEIVGPADAFDNQRDLPDDFSLRGTPQYITNDYTFRPCSVDGGGTPKGLITLRKAVSGKTQGALLERMSQDSAKTDVQSTVWSFTEYWCNSAYQKDNPRQHIYDPNVDDDLTQALGFYLPTVCSPDGGPLSVASGHMWTWDVTIELSAGGMPRMSLNLTVYTIDNSLDA